MTILGAMDCGDHFLFGVDSGSSKSGYSTTTNKLWCCDQPPVAWAFAGDAGVGRAFSEWLETRAPKGWENWDVAAGEIVGDLSRRNGERRAQIQLASGAATVPVQPRPEQQASALIVGCIGGVLRILEIHPDGAWGFQEYLGVLFAGSGGLPAMFVVHGIERATNAKLQRTAKGLRDAMEPVAEHAERCRPPVKIVRVSCRGVEDAD